ncbi:MAG: DUF1922 domain-containing protein [Candidatus Bathyarchaeota archaeon]|nr:DUF1922 domain-containing protein [Candidatus Bathyarchaeota archaeon]
MPPTAILECPKCGGLLLAATNQKTRTCPYCSAKVNVHKAKRLGAAENAFTASEMLRILKTKNQNNTRKNKPNKSA